MSAAQPSRAVGLLGSAALALYPRAWRARYGDEVQALLEDSGVSVRTVVSLACHAVPAWACPPRHLYDRSGRMRASLATVLTAWALLAGLAVVFVQLAQAQGSMEGVPSARYPVIEWSYWVFDGCLVVSVLAVAAGGMPLWLLMLRAARRARRWSVTACLLAPVAVPAAYIVASWVVSRLVLGAGLPRVPWQAGYVVDLANGPAGLRWLLEVILALAAGAVSAAGPGLALHRLTPRGPAVVLATRTAVLAAVTMGLAGMASVVATVGLYVWAPSYAGYHEVWQLAVYLPAVALTSAIAIVSAARGIRAARPPWPGSTQT